MPADVRFALIEGLRSLVLSARYVATYNFEFLCLFFCLHTSGSNTQNGTRNGCLGQSAGDGEMFQLVDGLAKLPVDWLVPPVSFAALKISE